MSGLDTGNPVPDQNIPLREILKGVTHVNGSTSGDAGPQNQVPIDTFVQEAMKAAIGAIKQDQ